MTNCPHALDDGAYVLGALSPSERAEYERHLASCPDCREAVAEIAVLPGLLGRLTDPAGLELSSTQPADRMPALLTAVGAQRRRARTLRRRRYAGAALIAAGLAAVVGIGVAGADAGWFGGRAGAGQVTAGGTQIGVKLVAMQPVNGAVPVTAEIGVQGTTWGTEISMRCTYESKGPKSSKAWTFRLVAHGADGAKEQVGSWSAQAGETVEFSGATRFTGRDLVRLELTRYDGTALLAYDVP